MVRVARNIFISVDAHKKLESLERELSIGKEILNRFFTSSGTSYLYEFFKSRHRFFEEKSAAD